MIICNSRAFVFIHIHKAGGTSMERALDPHLAWNDLVLGSTPLGTAINVAFKRRFGLNKHSSVADVREICGPAILDSHYVFALVRHPVDRLCSLYNFVGAMISKRAAQLGVAPADVAGLLDREPHLREQVPGLAFPTTRAFLETAGFSEFLHSPHAEQDRSRLTQLSRLRLAPDAPPAADAYRLEDIQAQLGRLQARIGVEFDFPHINRSRPDFVSPRDLSPEDRRFIETVYAEDYAAFGY